MARLLLLEQDQDAGLRHQTRHQGLVEQFGTATVRPECTVIVPLYKRTDFLEHQLAQFVHDPEFREVTDLIYVLDSPEQSDELAARAACLNALIEDAAQMGARTAWSSSGTTP